MNNAKQRRHVVQLPGFPHAWRVKADTRENAYLIASLGELAAGRRPPAIRDDHPCPKCGLGVQLDPGDDSLTGMQGRHCPDCLHTWWYTP